MDLTPLTDLSVLPVRIVGTAVEHLDLPANPGSTLRGAFGSALKALVCTRPDLPECPPCPFYQRCAYPYLFETQAVAGQAGIVGFEDLPRPYVVCGELGAHSVTPGKPLTWRATLIGRATEYLPYFVLAWREMGERGIGRGRGRFQLSEAVAVDLDGNPAQVLYDRESNCVRKPEALIHGEALARWFAARRVSPAEVTGLEVDFLSPTLLKHQGRPAQQPEFHVLWRALQRRLSLLRLGHGGGRPELDFAATIRAAEAVHLAGWAARDVSWSRYSRRQGQRVPMRGFVGSARYEGPVGPFLPALLLGTLLGVGDNCSLGQGQYRLILPGFSP